jgi:hypothetical protein
MSILKSSVYVLILRADGRLDLTVRRSVSSLTSAGSRENGLLVARAETLESAIEIVFKN